MRRFNKEEIDLILNLRKENKSLFEICKILNVSRMNKSSVYYHLRKNFGRSFKLVRINGSNVNFIGEIIGVFASDGNAVPKADYQIRFYLSSDEEYYAHSLTELLEKTFNKKPYLYKTHNEIIIRYKSKKIYNFLLKFLRWEGKKTYTIRLATLTHDLQFLIGFLRGYFDGDGYATKDYRNMEFVTTSKLMAKQIFEIISVLSVHPHLYVYQDKRKNRRICYYVKIRGENAVKLINLISPRNPKRVRDWAHSIAWSSIPATIVK